ncbi:hypothetical protein BGZ63DRAFT_426800 [Mariannaea sp. PMI_226]|nr:hypothetical protein BGZ63DRAFT_426800 [Mariannaea sp. PMI_226]
MGLINAKNPVPEHQRFYQNAYRAHTRLWKIPRLDDSLRRPPLGLLRWQVTIPLAGFYGATRKVLGYKTYFGKE